MVKVIGLTGPIGAGKDAVAKILRRRGAYIIDADAVAHSLYEIQSPVWHELIRVFGSKILMRGGKINRKKLGDIVFSDKKRLEELDRIIHPLLKEAILKIIADQKTGGRVQVIVINAAVLKEIGLMDQVDAVWVVLAPKATRLKRLIKSGREKTQVVKLINSQAPQKEYLKMADVIIKNETTLSALKQALPKLL